MALECRLQVRTNCVYPSVSSTTPLGRASPALKTPIAQLRSSCAVWCAATLLHLLTGPYQLQNCQCQMMTLFLTPIVLIGLHDSL